MPSRRCSSSPAGGLYIVDLLPQSCFVGCSDQSRDSGSVVNIVIDVPKDRSHQFVRQRRIEQCTERDPVLRRAANVVVGDFDAGHPDPVASFRQLIALPSDTAREAPGRESAQDRARSSIAGSSDTRLPKPMENGQKPWRT